MFGCSAPGESPPPVSRSTRGTVCDVRHDLMKTHTVVSEVHHDVANTHDMVSDIHRTIVKGQEGSDGGNASVSDTHALSTIGCSLTAA